MSQTVVSVFLGPALAEANQIPLFPAAVSPTNVFEGEPSQTADVATVEDRLDSNLGRLSDRAGLSVVFIGATFTFPELGIEYITAQDRLFELLAS